MHAKKTAFLIWVWLQELSANSNADYEIFCVLYAVFQFHTKHYSLTWDQLINSLKSMYKTKIKMLKTKRIIVSSILLIFIRKWSKSLSSVIDDQFENSIVNFYILISSLYCLNSEKINIRFSYNLDLSLRFKLMVRKQLVNIW